MIRRPGSRRHSSRRHSSRPHRSRTLSPILLALLTLVALGAAAPTVAEAPDETAFLEVMNRYLELADHYTELASRPETATYFAIEGIVEIYEARGARAEAVEHLERLLKEHGDDRTIRNLLRFKLRDLYNETGRSNRALEELETIIEENAG